MTLARLKVTIYPLDSKFKLVSFISKCIVCILSTTLIVSTAFTVTHIYTSDSQLLPTALCNIFYDPLADTMDHISALFLAIFQLFTCVTD